ncbi:MAG TPA: ankyrin repeat domain-containing protein [Candidatus Omnitrophota bacterium]|nr:ankyrin repeat domain-containing protein [Candidatus Omnitrophota bacterium]HPN56678.1 ankyrin repeat domain-containing protein [Candidatus Omnitrophota bacterium]
MNQGLRQKNFIPGGKRGVMSRDMVLGLSVLLAASGMIIFGLLPRLRPPVVDNAGRSQTPSADGLQFLESVRNGNFQAVREGLKSGADVNVQNEFGESALHLVRDPQIALFLIENGADVRLRDRESGMTPLFFQERPIAEMLVGAGADVNARSRKGNTPFLWYTYSGYQTGLQFLISAGADIQARNDDGQTALDIAEAFGSPELIEFLEAAGVRRGGPDTGESGRF